jgi:hypothetical protein
MKVFFDTEFTGLHKNTTLISLGCVDDNGRTFYAEFTDYDKSQVDDWINENVIKSLSYAKKNSFFRKNGAFEHDWRIRGDKTMVRETLDEWLSQYTFVELVSDVCHYDMVLLIDLFGDAFSLPENVNPSCHDINQDIAEFYGNVTERWAFEKSREEILKECGETIVGVKHNALYDAQVIRVIYNYITKQNANEEEQLKQIVLQELDACGYFIADCDRKMMRRNNPDWTPYCEKSFGEMLMDFAQYYNMSEENRDYVVFERKDCPTWRRGKPEETGAAYLLNFQDGSIACSTDYREYNNCFYYEDGEHYEKVSADDKDLRWFYVHELNNLPKQF